MKDSGNGNAGQTLPPATLFGTWQPISSAPKDGTHILAVEGEIIALVWWEEAIGEWRDMGDMGAAGRTAFEPSHWMPLPPPPNDKLSDRRENNQ